MPNQRFIILSLFLLFATTSYNQNKEVQFNLYAFEDGLSHRNVFKIKQDTSGFIWLATINGLNKFDGYNFVHYSTVTDFAKFRG